MKATVTVRVRSACEGTISVIEEARRRHLEYSIKEGILHIRHLPKPASKITWYKRSVYKGSKLYRFLFDAIEYARSSQASVVVIKVKR